MLKYGEANPLAVFGLRELEHCPPHFVQVNFDLKASEKTISDWVNTNLTGRFYYGDYYYKNSDNTVQISKQVAFEIPGEASMFALVLSEINKHEFDW